MTLEELVEMFREEADDITQPYLFSAPRITQLLNDAEREACIRGRLIHESVDPAVCEIAVSAGASVYPLHAALYEIDHIAFRATGDTRRCRLLLKSTEWLDDNVCGWRDAEGPPEYAVQTDKNVRLVPSPTAAGTLLLEGYRLPMAIMASNNDTPEINATHHAYLVHWALHKAFSKPDVDFYDPELATRSEAEFTRYFGPRPDADLRRTTREDEPHHVRSFWV